MNRDFKKDAREAWADFMSCLMCLPSTEWVEFEEKMAEHLNRTYGAYRAEKRAEYVSGERLDQILGVEVEDGNF